MMDELRKNPMKSFNGQDVVTLEDFSTSEKTSADGSKETINLPKSNVLKYWLADGTWLAIRPSGTEPKIKFYIGTEDDTQETVNQRLDSYIKAVNELIEKLV